MSSGIDNIISVALVAELLAVDGFSLMISCIKSVLSVDFFEMVWYNI